MFNGREGLLGSTPGRLLGIGWGSGTTFAFTLTHRFGGNWSSCSVAAEVSNEQNRNWTYTITNYGLKKYRTCRYRAIQQTHLNSIL